MGPLPCIGAAHLLATDPSLTAPLPSRSPPPCSLLVALPKSVLLSQLMGLRSLDVASNRIVSLAGVGRRARWGSIEREMEGPRPPLCGAQPQAPLYPTLPPLACPWPSPPPRPHGSLVNLRRLIVDGNAALGGVDGGEGEGLPSEIASLIHLEVLGIAGCRLSALPEDLATLTRLRDLRASGNRLRDLTPLASLSALEEADVSFNRVAVLPTALGRLSELQTLNLDGNAIEAVPTELLQAPRLARLSLHRNPIRAAAVRATPGWDEFEARRIALVDKGLRGDERRGVGVMMGSGGFDEGFDS